MNSFSNKNNTDSTVSVSSVSILSHWKADEIRLFDSYLDKSHEEEEVVTVSKKIYYWSVILFIKQIQNITTIKRAQLVQINLNICLYNSALTWYISELFNLEWVDLCSDKNSVKE